MSTTVKLTFETGDRSPDDVEREVRDVVEAATGEIPDTYQYAGNVVWYPSGAPDVDHVHDVEVPRAVLTRYNDTVDAGSGKLLERVDGQFVAVDAIASPEPDFGNYVLDYFRINYGIAPWYRYSKPDDPGTTARPADREDWPSLLSPDAFAVPDFADETAAAARLTADDRADRDRAVRYVACEGTDDPERYERFLATLSSVDERTRAVVAAALWTPSLLGHGATVDASLVAALLSLVDDPVPEVRIGAFMGASRAIDALHERVEPAADEPIEGFDDVVETFYESYEQLLEDPDPRIRERSVRCLSETLGDGGTHAFSDGLWLRIDFPLRWRIVRAVEENVHDETLGTFEYASEVTTTAFDGEHSAVPTLVEYVYEDRGPSHRAVRAMLADFAADEPEAATDALEPALDAVAKGDELVADVRLLAGLAKERPDRVATVAADLTAILEDPGDDRTEGRERRIGKDYVDQDDPEEKRRAAANVLNELPADAHSVDPETLAAVTGGITREAYGSTRLAPDRVATLCEVDPETAVEKLAGLPANVRYDINADDGFLHTRVDEAIYEASKAAPEVVARALPDLLALVEDAPSVSEDLAVAIARTADARPDAVAGHVDVVATCLGHYDPIVREAAATALVAVGRQQPDSLSAPYTRLLERADDALEIERLETVRERSDMSPETPADWPAGVIASDPSEFVDGVAACLDEGFYEHEHLATLLREVRSGDPEAAERALAALLERRRSAVLPSSYRTGVINRVAETDPALLAGVAESIVAVLADPAFESREHPDRESSRPTSEAKSLEAGLLAVATSDPATATAAIQTHYSSVEAFLEDHETDRRREIVSLAGDEEVTRRISGADAGSASEDDIVDPFYTFQPGEYGTDLVVDRDDDSEESTNEEVRLVRCRVTEDDSLRRIRDDSFVRRIVGLEGPLGTVPDDAAPDEEQMSLVMHPNVPEPFVRLAVPDGENVLTRVMDLDMDVDTFQLFATLCRSVGNDFDREEIEALERRLDQLKAIEDVDGAEELVREQLL